MKYELSQRVYSEKNNTNFWGLLEYITRLVVLININNEDVYQVNVAGSVIGAVDIAGPVTHGAIGEHIPGAMWSLFDV